MDPAIFMDWMSFAARWLHVITGIAWIGSSFYFIALIWACASRRTCPPACLARNGKSMVAVSTMCVSIWLPRRKCPST